MTDQKPEPARDGSAAPAAPRRPAAARRVRSSAACVRGSAGGVRNIAAAVRATAACVLPLAALAACAPPAAPGSGSAPPVARLSIHLPADAPLLADGGRPAVAVSRRGDRIVYVARRGGGTQLYIRPIEKFEAIPLPGTGGAADPFLSPEGDRVGFFAEGRLRTIALGGLAVETICEVPAPGGGASWAPDDTIVFAGGGDLWSVAVGGGTPERIGVAAAAARAPGGARTAAGAVPLWPEITPGGAAIVFTLRTEGPGGASGVAAFHRGRGEVRMLLEDAVYGRIAPTGDLLVVRDGNLIAVPFDAATLETRGRAVPVLEGVRTDARTGAAQYALAATGALVYLPAEPSAGERSLLWVDRQGNAQPLAEARRRYELPRLSADGRRLAIGVAEGDTLGLWIHDLEGGAPRRYPLEGSGALAVFTPDGTALIHVAPRAGAWNLLRRPADPAAARGAEPVLLWTGEHPLSPTSFSPAGDRLAVTEVRPDSRGDLLILPVGPGGRTGEPRPFLRTPADEWGAAFSPDGRFVAYTSNATGRNEVFVTPFADAARGDVARGDVARGDVARGDTARGDAAAASGAAGTIQVSRDGGYGPIWTRDGRELVFRSGDAVLAVPVRLRPSFAAGTPAILFRGPYDGASAGWANYDLAPDGRRFVMIRGRDDAGAARRLDVVLGFPEELRRAVARGQE